TREKIEYKDAMLTQWSIKEKGKNKFSKVDASDITSEIEKFENIKTEKQSILLFEQHFDSIINNKIMNNNSVISFT
ncbi:13788_t:CDS:2, partial [Rhizophagus irregularis]